MRKFLRKVDSEVRRQEDRSLVGDWWGRGPEVVNGEAEDIEDAWARMQEEAECTWLGLDQGNGR